MAMMETVIASIAHQQRLGASRAELSPARRRTESGTSVISGTVSLPEKHLDGGYGWAVVLGSGIVFIFVPAFFTCYGLMFLELLDEFPDVSIGELAWIPGLAFGLSYLVGPITSFLLTFSSSRQLIILSTITLSIAHIINALFTGYKTLFITHGVIGAAVSGISNTSASVLISAYFRKRRSLAITVLFTVSAVGQIFFPILIAYIFEQYGYNGAMFLLGGITLQGCVGACLMRPACQSKGRNPFTNLYLRQNSRRNGSIFSRRGSNISLT